MKEYNLTLEEEAILRKHKYLNQIGEEEEIQFWMHKYQNFSFDEKKQYWLSDIHHRMRIQGEVLADQYSAFSKNWYETYKKKEPDFDRLLIEVIPLLGFEFDWKEFFRRINRENLGD